MPGPAVERPGRQNHGVSQAPEARGGARVFAVAVVFGYGQYLFTRLVDQQAKTGLTSAGTRNDPGTTTHVPVGDAPPSMLTTRHPDLGRP
jgi:hypothetical protein